MQIEKFVVGIISTNCYLVKNEESKEAVIIDPGACPDYLVKHIISEGLSVKAVLLTHGHFDHFMGIEDLLEHFQVPVYVHEDDQKLLNDIELNCSKRYTPGCVYKDAISVKDGDKLVLAGIEFDVIHTPGHTGGGVCYYVKERNVLFSGDTLFLNTIGRADLPTSDLAELLKAIKEKLLILPMDTIVYPGHGGETTIEHEKINNPYMK